jgi:AcrR family transcriptional regulator
MKESTAPRPYRQRRRAEAAEANTERILQAALDLFLEGPWDQITLAAVADRAGVGVQTLIRRVGTKDGLSRAVNQWVAPQIAATRGEPASADPHEVAAALARHYERWGESADRTLRQQDASPALAEAAAGGRAMHRAWVERVFPEASPDTIGRLIGICGVELWLVLRRDGGLSPGAARSAVADLIAATLP